MFGCSLPTRRLALLAMFRKSGFALALVYVLHAAPIHAVDPVEPDEGRVKLRIRNDLSGNQPAGQGPVVVRLWSEKPWNPQTPVRQVTINRDSSAELQLRSPDRYTVEVRSGLHQWLTPPLPLKKVALENSGKELMLTTLATGRPGVQPPLGLRLVFSDGTGQLDGTQLKYFSAPSNMTQSLIVRNDFGRPVQVRVVSQRPTVGTNGNRSSGSRFALQTGGAATVPLVSPDPFTVEVQVDDQTLSAKGLELKDALAQGANSAVKNQPFLRISRQNPSNEPALTFERGYSRAFLDEQSGQPLDLFREPLNSTTDIAQSFDLPDPNQGPEESRPE